MPVQIYSSSPIHPSEADGQTPQTDEPKHAQAVAHPAAPPATTTTAAPPAPPPAQPAARPILPVQTAVPQRTSNYQHQPTPTQSQPPLDPATPAGPPAPQPGAAPLPPSISTMSPALPLRGQPHAAAAPRTAPPPPSAGPAPSPYTYAPTSSSSSAYTPRARYPRTQHGEDDTDSTAARNYAHPPGYQQNVHAAEFSSAQLAAHHRSVLHADGYGDEDGVWGTAKRWAAAAGESIIAAEEQIWKKINGD